MKKSIVKKIFISTMLIFLIAIGVQLLIQNFILDDIYRWIKSHQMEKNFNRFTKKYQQNDHLGLDINELTKAYSDENNASILLIDDEKNIINNGFFDALNYVTVQDENTGSYRVLIGNMADEQGNIRDNMNGLSIGNEVSVIGNRINGTKYIYPKQITDTTFTEG